MGIGSRLSELMKYRGTNANELAQKIGVAPTTIYSMIKRDSKKADIEVLIKIARELQVDAEYFCSGSPSASVPASPSYEDMEELIARNGKNLSAEEKIKLIKLLSELE
ncbi:helix-turn-helix domain-containing protein [Lacrimispora sp. NSJ-141]|uniref:Helix-turn-helix domain-containing protein n=1 Tax=Lientehia hominis TaxID=2897778 RepID=A0AAP2RI94_9FIRM|nr:helix-turn-helix transcriptional regulator [Lientehia hominis]MCD2492517.1 helix-turn-helix domain-containing protein [Lientehia hominis]